MRTRWTSTLALLATLSACTGRLGDVDPPSDAAVTPDVRVVPRADVPTVTDRPATDVPTPTAPPFAPAPATLQRLTRAQYERSLTALLGDVRLPTNLEADTPLYGFSTIGASQLSIANRAAEQFQAAAEDVAHQVFSNASRRMALVGCAPTSATDDCAQGFVSRFGRLAFRRPLTADELTRWRGVAGTVYGTFHDTWVALEWTVAGMLQSPSFLYRIELGSPDPSHPGWRRYDGYEMASRLAFLLWNAPPDSSLLDDAAAGRLDSPSGLRARALAMLADPRAHDAVARFFTEYFKLDRLDTLARDPTAFPLITATLGASMRGEVLRLLDDVVFSRDADLREMFDTRATFVNAELARLYNLPFSGDGFTRATLPADGPRAGVLTTAAFLTLNAHASATSPTLRGRFIRQYLLCQEIPPPPEGVVTSLPASDPMMRTTLRQRLEQHRTDPTCAGCHNLMDPLGFSLENFDALGVYRTTDNGLPVDPRGSIDGVEFRSARELAAILREHPRAASCVTRQLYRYATGHVDLESEARALDALSAGFAGEGYRLRALLVALTASDGFRYALDGGT